MNDQIRELLRTIRPEFDFDASSDFVMDGMLDSYDLILLVAELDRVYKISISGKDIVPENFDSIEAISSLVRKYLAAE